MPERRAVLIEAAIQQRVRQVPEKTAVQLEISDFGFEVQDSSNFLSRRVQDPLLRFFLYAPWVPLPVYYWRPGGKE